MINRYRNIKKKIKFFLKVNWIKTIYFNFKKFPFSIAKKLPVFFYGKVKFQDISGEIIINAPIRKGMIGFGKKFEKQIYPKAVGEFTLIGKIVFNGFALFGKEYFIYVDKDAVLEIGNFSGMGSKCKLICTNSISISDNVRISYETQLIDSNFHQMIDTETNKKFDMNGIIILGKYNFIGNRTTISQNTITPNFCTIASNSLCTKDYTSFGENILIGGVPAKLLKTNISRDWEGEREKMDVWLKI